MRSKGFTLIELLAVIVILAIIALIATPVVINIINDSKKESINRSIELYMDHVQKVIAKEQMKDPTFNPSECEIKPKGILECKNGTRTYSPIKIEMKGQMPKSGTIKFSKGMVIEGKNIELDNLYYQVTDDNISEGTKEKESSGGAICTGGGQSTAIGTKYSCEVKPGKSFNFYVLSVEGDKVNLIMDRNICNDGTISYTDANNYCRYKWYSSANNNTYGPTTVMAELYAGTKDWDNVSDMIMNYTDENNGTATDMGYTSIITSNGVTTITGKPTTNVTTIGKSAKPLKARLPKQSEVMGAGCTTSNGSCPTWLMENMTYWNGANDKYSMNNNSEAYQNQIYGYWLLSSHPGYSNNVRSVLYYGNVYDFDTTSGRYGARPVITVSTSDLSN